MRHRGPVDDLSTVSSSVFLGDREPQSGAVSTASRFGTAREPVEQARDELMRTPSPRSSTTTRRCRSPPTARDGDRGLAVAHRVRDQVREHPIERCRIHHRLQVGRNRDCHRIRTPSVSEWTSSSILGRRRTGSWRDTDRRQVEPGQVEQLFRQSPHPSRLLTERAPKSPSVRLGQLVLSFVQRDGDAVDARQRVPQLVCGEREVLALPDVELPAAPRGRVRPRARLRLRPRQSRALPYRSPWASRLTRVPQSKA